MMGGTYLKKLIVLLLIAAFVFGTNAAVQAEGLNEPEINYNNNVVIISGQVNSEYAGRYVSLQILNPGKSIDSLIGKENVLNWSDQGRVQKDGTFSFTVNMVGDTGTYNYFVGIDGIDNTFVGEPFVYFSDGEVNVVWSKIQNALKTHNTDDILWVINERAILTKIDKNKFDYLSPDEKSRVLTGIVESTINDLTDFLSVYNESIYIIELYKTEDADAFGIAMNELTAKASKAVNNLYDGFSAEQQAQVIEMTINCKSSVFNAEQFVAAYTDNVLLTSLNSKLIRAEMDKFITEEAQIDSDTVKEYAGLSNRLTVAERLLDKLPFSSMKVFIDELNKAIEYSKSESNDTDSSSSSGNGGRGKGKYTLPSVISENDIDDSDNNRETSKSFGFDDIANDYWAVEDIREMYYKNVISGDENRKFRPEDNITRAEFVKMAVAAFNVGATEINMPFTDVSNTDWFFDYIKRGYGIGIVKGTSENTFSPHKNITRQDMVVILCNIAEQNNINMSKGEIKFADTDEIAEYATSSVSALVKLGVIEGYSDNTIRPINKATRAEAVVLINRMLQHIKGGAQ